MKLRPENIPTDIYRMLMTKRIGRDVNKEGIAEMFADACKAALLEALEPDQVREGRLRMSNIGKPDRLVYNDYHGINGEQLDGSTYVKFLYGHIVEALLIALTQLSGHEVTEQQKEVEVNGVKGSQDCRIDGVLCDVKSASSFGYKKFKNREMPFDDPFGYVAQIRGYAAAEGDTKYGWLVMDKQHGNICWAGYDEATLTDKEKEVMLFDVEERIAELVKLVGMAEPPQICYDPIPDGSSGNKKLATGCSYCAYKHQCFPKVRTFIYSSGPRYLTEVVKVPKVTEVVEGF